MGRILVAVVIAVAAFVGSMPTAGATGCTFQLGFAALHSQIPAIVGNCQVDEHHNPDNGDGLQETTNGLMVWRKADNWTAFTDGYKTWINGPSGLVSRLNTERFSWEHDVQPSRPVAVATPAPVPTSAVAAAIASATSSAIKSFCFQSTTLITNALSKHLDTASNIAEMNKMVSESNQGRLYAPQIKGGVNLQAAWSQINQDCTDDVTVEGQNGSTCFNWSWQAAGQQYPTWTYTPEFIRNVQHGLYDGCMGR